MTTTATTPLLDSFTAYVDTLGLDQSIVDAAAANLAAGTLTLLAVTGKMAAGKDTVAPAVFDTLAVTDVDHQYFAIPIKAEMDTIIATVAAATRPGDAIDAVAATQNVSAADAAFIVGLLWADTRDVDQLPNARTRTVAMRAALQYWGTDVRRAVDADYWVRKSIAAAVTAMAAGRSVYVTDARFPNEIDAARAVGFTVVRLDVTEEVQRARMWERDGIEPDVAALAHPSETALDDYPDFDVVIDNNGALERTVQTVAEILRAGRN